MHQSPHRPRSSSFNTASPSRYQRGLLRHRSVSFGSSDTSSSPALKKELLHRVRRVTDVAFPRKPNLALHRIIPVIFHNQLSQVTIDILESLFRNPAWVSDSDLGRLFSIEESSHNSLPLPSGSICYWRSWELSGIQLLSVIDDLTQQNFSKTKLSGLTRGLFGTRWHNRVVTIRYVGMTTAPHTPWIRATKEKPRKRSLKGAFINAVERLLGKELGRGRIFSLTMSSVPALLAPKAGSTPRLCSFACDFERAIISLFGRDSLLNLQAGGKYADVSPSLVEECAFYSCQTSLSTAFNRCQVRRNLKLESEIETLHEAW